jgi:hypothetical protein
MSIGNFRYEASTERFKRSHAIPRNTAGGSTYRPVGRRILLTITRSSIQAITFALPLGYATVSFIGVAVVEWLR